MKRKIIYCIATLLIAIGAFLFLPKGSEDDPSSENKPDSIVQGKSGEEVIAIEKNSGRELANIQSNEFQQIFERFKNAKVTAGGPSRTVIYITYVDEKLADDIGLDRHEQAEMEKIIDYYKEEMDQININNAKVSTLSDNKFLIEIPKVEEQGLEIRNKLTGRSVNRVIFNFDWKKR